MPVPDNQQMGSTERNERPSVLSRAAALLEALARADGSLTVTELSAAAGLPKTTAFRLAEELVGLRLLARVAQGYELGMRLFELGELVPQRQTIQDAALPYMEDLRTATGHSVHLAILDGAEVVYIQILRAKDGPVLPSRVGGRLPAHATGVGKAMLAFAPPEAVQRVIETGLPRLTSRTIATPGQLRRELAAIRENGVALDHEESAPGIRCAASPVIGAEHRVVAALSVTGFSPRWSNRMAPAVQTAALALSRELSRTPTV